MDLEQLIATATPRTQTVRVCGRGDLASRHAELVSRLNKAATAQAASLGGDASVRDLAAEVVAVEDEMESTILEVTVRALSRNEWADLLAAHPPSREEARRGESMNPKTFPVAAVAACSHEPSISQAQAEALASKLPTGEWQKLWMAVVSLNTAETTVPKLRAATELLQVNGRSSTTSDPEESPAVSSLAGSGAP